ncbi:MAG: hypothetical protein ACJAUJ_001678 [Salibacteraceae bacterium]|jgi:hypothetical protein
MNFKVDFQKSKNIMNEISCGYFSVWRQISMLRESIENAQSLQESNTHAVCLGIKCVQEALFYASVTEINSWFIDSKDNVASLHYVISKLKDVHFSKSLEAWYSKPPDTVSINQSDIENPKFWHQDYIASKKVEFQSKKDVILHKYEQFSTANATKRVSALRNKHVAHKDFKNNELYKPSENAHKFSDTESVLKLLDDFIFDLNHLFNKSTYLEHPSNFDSACKDYWNSLKST